MSDEEIIRLLKESPEKGLEAVVRRYTAYVLKIANTKLNGICSREDIEETVSDIFYMFYRQGVKCGFEIRSVRAYISLIAQRHCIDVFRKQAKQLRTEPLDEFENIAELAEHEACDELADAVKSLGEPDSEIFIRKYFFGQTSAEIGNDLNMKANTVDKRISRGIVKLRKIMKEEQQ